MQASRPASRGAVSNNDRLCRVAGTDRAAAQLHDRRPQPPPPRCRTGRGSCASRVSVKGHTKEHPCQAAAHRYLRPVSWPMRASHRPFWWRVTPRNLDVPRVKPLLWRRSDSTSSSVDTCALGSQTQRSPGRHALRSPARGYPAPAHSSAVGSSSARPAHRQRNHGQQVHRRCTRQAWQRTRPRHLMAAMSSVKRAYMSA